MANLFVSYVLCSTEFLYLVGGVRPAPGKRRRLGIYLLSTKVDVWVGGRDNCSGYVMSAISVAFHSPSPRSLGFPFSKRVAYRLGPSLNLYYRPPSNWTHLYITSSPTSQPLTYTARAVPNNLGRADWTERGPLIDGPISTGLAQQRKKEKKHFRTGREWHHNDFPACGLGALESPGARRRLRLAHTTFHTLLLLLLLSLLPPHNLSLRPHLRLHLHPHPP